MSGEKNIKNKQTNTKTHNKHTTHTAFLFFISFYFEKQKILKTR